ncbi:helix-turn-helix domain-containing protein [Pedobacter africanus]|uniref:AraC-like DNA-binding protein n=1 Tax=Pedobacter africanus TaxID=151894 RepID=A0ACC6L1X4_9SPHI|nr:helix-turn-helix domain-containing protein [Pedobacter africanus]MDR6785363.1 AraC-like DNA-binding protein [Pedobacter africanus]
MKHFISDDKRLSVLEWLHFIPVVLFIIHVLPLGFGPFIDWDSILKQITNNKQLFITERSGLLPAYFYYIGRPLLVLGYLAAAWCVVLRSAKLKAVKDEDPGKRWILILIRAATFFQLISFIPLISGGLQPAHPNSVYVIIGCLVMLFVMVFVLHRPEIFYRYLFMPADSGLAKVEDIKTQQAELVTVPASPTKKTNLLPAELCSEYARMMQAFMENNKAYLIADFQIVDLATAVDIPVHHCSFIVNNHIGKNFRDWINGYRVRHFMEQYPLKSEKMTIEAIAQESGFKSLSTFYNAFKKETGLMPKAYFSQKKGS